MSSPDQAAVYSILIDIQAKLAEIKAARAEFKQAREEGESLGSLFRTGLGIGGGMEIARRGVELFKATIEAAIESSARLSDEIERATVRAGLSAEGFQALSFHLKQAGGSSEELVSSIAFLRRTLGEAGDPKSPVAAALAEIGLSARALAGLSVEQQLEKIAAGLARVADESRRATLQAALLGRGSATLNDLIDQLATHGLANLTTQAQRASGVLSGDMARAIDAAGDRAAAAQEKFGKIFAPITLKSKEAKASIMQLMADLAEAVANNPGGSAIALGAGTAIVGAGAVASAGGLGGPAAWGMVAASVFSQGLQTTVPMWAGFGAVLAAGFYAALKINQAANAALDARQGQTDSEMAEDARRRALAGKLASARDQGTVDYTQQEAARLARRYTRDASQTDDADERARLQGLAQAYSLIVARAREHGAEIVAANRALDAQNTAAAKAAQLADQQAAAIKAMADDLGKNSAAEKKLDFDAADPAGKLRLLEAQRAEAEKTHDALAAAAKTQAERDAVEQDRRVAIKTIDAQILELREKIATTGPDMRAEKDEELSPAAIEATRRAIEEMDAEAKRAEEQASANRLAAISGRRAALDANPTLGAAEKRDQRLALIKEENKELDAQIAALKTRGDLDAQDQARLDQLSAKRELNKFDSSQVSDYQGRQTAFKNQRDGVRADGGQRLTAGQGIGAGAVDYVTQLGTAGEQLAQTFSGVVSNSVSTVADGIVGLITKTKSLGDVGRSMGMMFLQTFAQLAVQLLAQKALTLALTAAHVAGEGVKTTATVTGAGIRAGAAATETAVEHTSTLGKLANAAIGAMSAMASIPYVGPILAIAAAGAIIAMGVKLMKREHGGPVKKGESYLVGEKRPEVFVPDQDGHIVPSVDQYRDRYTMPATSTTGGSYASSGASGAIAAGAARPTRFIHVQATDLVSARRMAREPDFDNVMLDWSQRHRGEIVA